MFPRSTLIGAFLSAITALAQDPFEKDPRLHQSLYGIAYTPPFATNLPTCGDTIDAVIRDVQLMSQLTTRIRLYGSDCGTSDLVLEALNRTQLPMEVFLAIYLEPPATVSPANTELVYNRMLEANIAALKKWGTRNVAGITVGNEYILDQIRAGQTAQEAEQFVIAKMLDTRTKIKALDLDKPIPVGTSDAGGMITVTLSEGSDYVFANVHSWFAGVTIDQAAAWTFQSLLKDQPASALQASNKPPLYSSEVGWPTNAVPSTIPITRNGSIASIENTQILLDTFVCTANAMPQNETSGYFWFEFADAAWKADKGGVEPFWGLFDKDRNLKNLTIPVCPANAAVLPPLSSSATILAPPTSTTAGSASTSTQKAGSQSSASPNRVLSFIGFPAVIIVAIGLTF